MMIKILYDKILYDKIVYDKIFYDKDKILYAPLVDNNMPNALYSNTMSGKQLQKHFTEKL